MRRGGEGLPASCCATSSRAIPPRSSPRCAPSPSGATTSIIGIGFAQTPIVEAVAKDYPKINFAIVDGVSDLPNVASLVFKEHEGCYLVGMIAAKKSKTGVLGFIGGMDIPLIHGSRSATRRGRGRSIRRSR